MIEFHGKFSVFLRFFDFKLDSVLVDLFNRIKMCSSNGVSVAHKFQLKCDIILYRKCFPQRPKFYHKHIKNRFEHVNVCIKILLFVAANQPNKCLNHKNQQPQNCTKRNDDESSYNLAFNMNAIDNMLAALYRACNAHYFSVFSVSLSVNDDLNLPPPQNISLT